MRLTSFGVVLAVMVGLLAGRAGAQIPEKTLFQPGSYAQGHFVQNAHAEGVAGSSRSIPTLTQKVLVELPVEAAIDTDDDTPKTAWEEIFAAPETVQVEVEVPIPTKVVTAPYLAWHRNPITKRVHVVPYQPGYAASPEEFPKHQSKLNLWLSSLPSRSQDRPQVKYAGYYDPAPEIVEDKPSRCQLILGYSDEAWTSTCENRWGFRMAQCPGVVPIPTGTFAEVGIKDQPYDYCVPTGTFGGIFQGPRPIDYGQGVSTQPGFGRLAYQFGGQCPCEYHAGQVADAAQPGPYTRPMCPVPAVTPRPLPGQFFSGQNRSSNCTCDHCRCGHCNCGHCVGGHGISDKVRHRADHKVCGCGHCVKHVSPKAIPEPPAKE